MPNALVTKRRPPTRRIYLLMGGRGRSTRKRARKSNSALGLVWNRRRLRRRPENIRLSRRSCRSRVLVSAGAKNRGQGWKNADKNEVFQNQVVTCLMVHSPQASFSGVFNPIARAQVTLDPAVRNVLFAAVSIALVAVGVHLFSRATLAKVSLR